MNKLRRTRVAFDLIFAASLISSIGCIDLSGLFQAQLLFNVEDDAAHDKPPGPVVFRERDVFDDISGRVGHHAASITTLPTNELLVAWYSYSGPHELEGTAIFTARFSNADATWSTPRVEIERDVSCGNPVLYSEGENVWLFFAEVPFGWSTAHIEVQRSTDAGATWSPSSEIAGPLGSNVRYPPVRTQNGRLLLPAYDDLLHRSLFFTSEDGQDWHLQATVGDFFVQAIQPAVVRLNDDRLLSVMRNVLKGEMWGAASDNDGVSWTRPSESGFPNPDSAAVLFQLSNGHLILVYNDSSTERRPLSVALSMDEGLTWPFGRILANGEETYSYPSVTQTTDGLIQVVFSVARRTIRHATFSESWIAEEE